MTLAKQFIQGTTCAKGNHTVTEIDGTMVYLLHGHVIARWTPGESLELSYAGHPTVTTAKAVNAILAQFPFLPFTLKAWILTDVRTGRKLPFPADGFVRLERNPEQLSLAQLGMGAQPWFFADEVKTGNAPTIGGK